MRYCLLILLFCFSSSVFAVTPPASQQAGGQEALREQRESQRKLRETIEKPLPQLVRNIVIEGFVLQDKNQFVKLFKPYRNKYLSTADIDTILQELQVIYERAGYQGLISIEHHIKRKCLTFSVSLIK